MPDQIKKGSELELSIENLAFGGKGIARLDGMVVFVERALPGDRVKARVTRRKPQYAEAKLLEVLEPSPNRLTARCSHFGVCGGCTWQNFDYPQQLHYKQQHVEESLRHIGKQHGFRVHPILPSPDPWNYRNKMEFSFGSSDEGQIEIGFHQAGDFRRIVNIEQCHIQPAPFNDVLEFLRIRLNEIAPREGAHFAVYSQKRHSGFLRHLVLRHSLSEGTFLIALITATGIWKSAGEFASEFMQRFPECRGFTWGTNDGLSDVARMEQEKLRVGDGYIQDRIGEKVFRISTFSFFQTNTAGAKLLYDTVREYCELSGRENVLDAYCGTGTIGIYVSDLAGQVVGIELVRDAVWDARNNAKLNRAENCTFLAGEMREVLAGLPKSLGVRFDRVIVDPPRGGMDKKSLRLLIEIGAPLLVYVSCNPSTLSRDAVTLSEAGYVAEDVQPVDMFPHTFHVESVIKFRKKDTILEQIDPARD